MDAIVAERLTASPRIFDIYGLCGYTVLSEFFPHGDMEDILVGEWGYAESDDLDDSDDVNPQNNLTSIEKVTIALHMAEAIADLHSYPGGVIIHADIDPKQFLYNADKSLTKLNDFNRAEWMLWDDEKQDYCRYSNGGGLGNVSIVAL
jgi:serine/threonine protein kinase